MASVWGNGREAALGAPVFEGLLSRKCEKKGGIMTKRQIIKIIISVVVAALTALGASLGLSSCNVTRVVTNESKYTTRGDTAVMITTRTVETYDARKHLNY